MDYKTLGQTLRQLVTIPESMLSDVLGDTSKFLIVPGTKKRSADSVVGADGSIIAKTPLRVCKKPPDGCVTCEDLHLCKYLVCGSCTYGNKCKNSHDLDSAHNQAVRDRHNLQKLDGRELFVLLLQNDSSLLPEVCSHYNKGNGEHGSCKYKESCKNLHICLHFLQGDCAFGATCKRAHTFDAGSIEILKRRGVSADNIRALHTTYKNMLAIAGYADGPAAGLCSGGDTRERSRSARAATPFHPPPPTPPPPACHAPAKGFSRQPSSGSVSEADSNEICLFFLRRHCSFKEKCIRVHYHLPYRWQVLEADGSTWKDLPDMEDIEQAYCNPANDTSKGISQVDFITMTCGPSKVRRLSSASSITKPPHYILTTDWLWYWKSDQGKWFEFGSEGDKNTESSVTSQMLENVYLADTDTEILFTAGSQNYALHFKEMVQRNLKYKTQREVRRRPRFLSGKDVEKKLKSSTTEASGSSASSTPQHWDLEALPDFDYKLIRLSATSTEFAQIQKLFKRTMASSTVHSIQRIENPSLRRVFQWQKEKMQSKNGGLPVEQRLLFHGTEQSLTQAICEQNFDWRICGIHGSSYGKGSYFARDASYSDRFSKSSGKTKIMFVVQVLVGEYTKGKSSYLRPPPKDGEQRFYDSCVDSVANPAIFVIFEKHQIYPDYIIEYSP